MSELILQYLARMELSTLSTAVREVWWVFPSVLVLHSLSMAMVAGFGVVISTRALGFIAALPITALTRFVPLFWLGLVIAALSGLILLIAYPAKALTNPLFYLKLLMLAGASWICLQLLKTRWGAASEYKLAALGLVAWMSVIFAGRFLAYTHSVLMASWLVSPTGG